MYCRITCVGMAPGGATSECSPSASGPTKKGRGSAPYTAASASSSASSPAACCAAVSWRLISLPNSTPQMGARPAPLAQAKNCTALVGSKVLLLLSPEGQKLAPKMTGACAAAASPATPRQVDSLRQVWCVAGDCTQRGAPGTS